MVLIEDRLVKENWSNGTFTCGQVADHCARFPAECGAPEVDLPRLAEELGCCVEDPTPICDVQSLRLLTSTLPAAQEDCMKVLDMATNPAVDMQLELGSLRMCRCFTKIPAGLAMANFQCYFDKTAKEGKKRLVEEWRECQKAEPGLTTHVTFCALLLTYMHTLHSMPSLANATHWTHHEDDTCRRYNCFPGLDCCIHTFVAVPKWGSSTKLFV